MNLFFCFLKERYTNNFSNFIILDLHFMIVFVFLVLSKKVTNPFLFNFITFKKKKSNFSNTKKFFSSILVQMENSTHDTSIDVDVDIISFDLDSHTIKNPIQFNSLSDKEKHTFLLDSFFSIFIKYTNSYQSNCLLIDNVSYINDEQFFPFYEVLDIHPHSILVNNTTLTFYSLCYITNNSFTHNISNKFEIKLFFVVFMIRQMVSEHSDVYYDIRERFIISEYLSEYVKTNKLT